MLFWVFKKKLFPTGDDETEMKETVQRMQMYLGFVRQRSAPNVFKK